MKSIFFFKKKKIKIKKLFPDIKKNDFFIENVKPLNTAKKKDISFFDSIKYKSSAVKTNAGVCIIN